MFAEKLFYRILLSVEWERSWKIVVHYSKNNGKLCSEAFTEWNCAGLIYKIVQYIQIFCSF